MTRLATAIVVAALIGTPVFAADMAVKAPSPPPAAVYNWTGWYAGVNAGASFGNVKTDFNAAPAFFETVPITPGFGFSDREAPSGFIGGGQIGYNWQYSPLIVVGIEADIQGALERDTTNNLTQNFTFESFDPTGKFVSASIGTVSTSYTTQIDWFGTVRARIGYVWGNGEVLSYITGGLAYGQVKISGTNLVSGLFETESTGGSFTTIHSFGHSHVNTGWVVGYGTEGRLAASNWTWKVEGLYMDLGTLDDPDNPVLAVNASGGTVNTHSHFTDGILRGGLNYKFY